MRFFPNISIRRKQTLIIMLTSSTVLLLACAAFVTNDTLTFRRELVENVSVLAEAVGNNCAAAIDFNDPKSATDTLAALHANDNIISACVYTRDGEVFAVYQREAGVAFVPPAVRLPSQLFNQNALNLFRSVEQHGEVVGTIFVASNLNDLWSRLRNYLGIVGMVCLASLLLALMLSSQLQRVVSDPILNLAQVARMVALEKNYSVRATKQSNDELGQLVDGFNEMLAQIQLRDSALQAAQGDLELRVEARTKELAESQSLYLSLVDQMPAGVFRKDAAGRYVFVNSWFCRIKGMSADLLLGKLPKELAAYELASQTLEHPEASSEARLAVLGTSHHELIMETGQRIEAEEEYLDAAGQPLYLRVVKSPVFGFNQIIVGSQGMLFDVTARKRAEAELTYQRDLLQGMLDHSPDQIYFKDAQSRFLKASRAMAAKFGLTSADELVGKSDADFYTEEHGRPAFEDEQAIIRTGQPLIGKVEKEVLKTGQVLWALTTKMPLREKDGRIIGTFGISKDITIIKDTEAKMVDLHRQLLETSRQAGMAEIATNVLHNIGNVLNSVNVSASVVANAVKKSKAASLAKVVTLLGEHKSDLGTFFTSDPRGRQLPGYLSQLTEHFLNEQKANLRELELLQGNIDHIKEIVAMQQNYAKVSGLKEVINLNELVEDCLRMNDGAMNRHQVKVVREFGVLPPMTVEKHKILQILVNLVRNAKHACQDSLLSGRQLTVRTRHEAGLVKISVMDNGVGIPPENLIRIFNHGFTTRKDGHGFGLHSGALAAKEMGGSLTVFSAGSGQGAIFTLELPCDQPVLDAFEIKERVTA